MDFRIELVPLPVTDVDRAVAFYGDTVGWNVDFDRTVHEGCGSCRSPRPARRARSASASALEMLEPGRHADDPGRGRRRGRGAGLPEGLWASRPTDVEELPWGRFVRFADPDGNRWALQQIVRPT
jgi:catechol 2,3-dioxygenase-like lactoylglutathione lyase family enzyme